MYSNVKKQQPSSFWTGLNTDHIDLFTSTPSGPHLTFGHRHSNAAGRLNTQRGGVCRALWQALAYAFTHWFYDVGEKSFTVFSPYFSKSKE